VSCPASPAAPAIALNAFIRHRYIRWTLSSYPSGPSHASHLVPLLERATREFVHDKRYTNDIRYLRLWVLYAKYVDAPKDIFR
jgi:checkpoint serine/threonine-protein kinase